MPTGEQRTRATTYRDAAVQHALVARELYDSGRLAESNYLAGLAVECMLRAYRVLIDPEFDARHDLEKLYKVARFAHIVPSGFTISISAAIGDVIVLWSNDHRFLDDVALRKRWSKRKLYQGIKGDSSRSVFASL
jgi:hypothetical protein